MKTIKKVYIVKNCSTVVKNMKSLSKIIIILVLLFFTLGCLTTDDSKDISNEQLETLKVDEEQTALINSDENKIKTIPSSYDSSLVKDYEIVETEDDSWNNAIRKQYRVLVSTDISKEELKATLIQIVLDETDNNPDLDAISIFAYDRRTDINGIYTFGKLDWCPNGNWGDVTSEIASNNDRTTYEYVFDIKEKVGTVSSDKPTKLEFEIYNYFLISCDNEWDKIDLNDPYAYVDEEMVKQNVAKEYGVSVEEVNAICTKVVEYNYS